MEKVIINSEYITLGQFLKFTNTISSGSEAKLFLTNNKILINKEKENRRGRKLYDSYIVEINDKKYQVIKE